MINGVHDHPSDLGTFAEPACPARFTDTDILMVDIADLSDGGLAFHEDLPDLAGGKSNLCISLFFGHQLAVSAGGSDQLSPLADLQFQIMDQRPQGNVLQRYGIAGFDVGFITADHGV